MSISLVYTSIIIINIWDIQSICVDIRESHSLHIFISNTIPMLFYSYFFNKSL